MASKTQVLAKVGRETLENLTSGMSPGKINRAVSGAGNSSLKALGKEITEARGAITKADAMVARSNKYARTALNGTDYRNVRKALKSAESVADDATKTTANAIKKPTYKPLRGNEYRKARGASNGGTGKGPMLKSNEAIDPKKKGGLFNADPVIGFFKEGYQGLKDTGSTFSRISKEMGDDAKLFDTAKRSLKEVYMKDGSYDIKKIAGSYMVGAGAMRVATGGGLYKDRNGKTDIVGIPLI